MTDLELDDFIARFKRVAPAEIMPLFIQETFINKTRNARIGETEVYQAFTDEIGKLYRDLVREYGRCRGKVYIDRVARAPMAIGWTFEKRVKYDDSPETYLREVWVSVHSAKPTKTIEYHYVEVS